MRNKNIFFILIIFIFYCCSSPTPREYCNTFLHEPCMIVNQEQNNAIEGTYITVTYISISESSISIDFPPNFFITNQNCTNWQIGWGNNIPLFDAGVENLRNIVSIDRKTNKIILGACKRGTGFPVKNQRIVFWNTKPSGFENKNITPIINPAIWQSFSGTSIHIGGVAFDSTLQKWILLANEVDTSKIQIYAATSLDLIHWKAANNGYPILTAKDFSKTSWAGFDKTGTIKQAPIVSNIIRHNNCWYIYFHGYDSKGKRHIGMAISKYSLLNNYTILPNAIVSPGTSGSWNEQSCFYPKITLYNNQFVMAYNGEDSHGNEKVGLAFSKDLYTWKNSSHNPIIGDNFGWRSSTKTCEPAYIYSKNDTLFLLIAGAKQFKMGFWNHYITQRMYLDKSGNVDDAELGIYFSTDGGKTCKAHSNNPVFVNDYSNCYENEHMGGNFNVISTDTATIILYQAKSSFISNSYKILMRIKK